MNSHKKRWLMMAGIFVGIGLILLGAVMTVYRWDFSKLSTVKYETNTHEITESFRNLSILTDTAEITLVPSEDGTCTVVCTEESGSGHAVSVREGRLTIELSDHRKWYEHIGIGFGKTRITVTMPQGEYSMLSVRSDTGDIRIPDAFGFSEMDLSLSTGDVTCAASVEGCMKIRTTTGDITVNACKAEDIELSVSTGSVTVSDADLVGALNIRVSTGKSALKNVRCDKLRSEGSTGQISMENVTAERTLFIRRTTGDVTLRSCDAGELYIRTDTGDISGSLCTGKNFSAKTDTGRVELPDDAPGGLCEIITTTGNIKMAVLSK